MTTSDESEIYSSISDPRTTLNVGYSDSSLKFNPFAVGYDCSVVVEMMSVRLLTIDRNGNVLTNAIDGEAAEFNGNTYKYTGISNLEIINNESGQTEFLIKLRRDIKCYDGYNITVDDVIFTMYVLSDPTYNGPQEFSKLPIVGIDDYKKGTADNIIGITRVDDSALSIRLTDFDVSYVSKLNFFIAPICHYGDAAKYNYDDNSFGFEKGDVESIVNDKIPYGAGPYRFVSMDGDTIKLERNLWYYKGIPNLEFVELRYCATQDMLTKVSNGSLDVVEFMLDDGLYEELISINGAEDGIIFNTSIFDYDMQRMAVVVNASAVDVSSYSAEYTKDFSWINEIHLMQTKPGF